MSLSRKFAVFFILLLLFIGGYLVFYGNPSITGHAIEDIKDLQLTPQCSDDPGVYKVWRIKNQNDFSINYTWNLLNDSQNGSGTAETDKNYLNTTSINGSNILELIVNGSVIDTKLWEPEDCPCIENWTCMNWSDCINESQTRNCSDLNNCNTTVEIPLLTQNCTVEDNETEQNQTVEEPVVQTSSSGAEAVAEVLLLFHLL